MESAAQHATPEPSERSALADEPRLAPTKSFRFPIHRSIREPSATAMNSSELQAARRKSVNSMQVLRAVPPESQERPAPLAAERVLQASVQLAE